MAGKVGNKMAKKKWAKIKQICKTIHTGWKGWKGWKKWKQ